MAFKRAMPAMPTFVGEAQAMLRFKPWSNMVSHPLDTVLLFTGRAEKRPQVVGSCLSQKLLCIQSVFMRHRLLPALAHNLQVLLLEPCVRL